MPNRTALLALQVVSTTALGDEIHLSKDLGFAL